MDYIENGKKIFLERLVAFIKDHSVDAWVDDGKLFAVEKYSYEDCRVVCLEANISAVRDWLGY